MPERLRLSRRRGARLPEGARSVARPSRHGNPFRVGDTVEVTDLDSGRLIVPGYGEYWIGDLPAPRPPMVAQLVVDARLAVALFRVEWEIRLELIRQEGADFCEDWIADLDHLRGHDLACWCELGAPCHADVLLELANTPEAWWRGL